MSLDIVQIPAGEMKNFAYLLLCPETGSAVAVDPSFAPEAVMEAARSRGVTIETVVATHGHQDHVAGVETVCREAGARLAAHPDDLPEAEIHLHDGDRLTVGRSEVEILHTPGHTPGCITLHPPGALITGDTLFVTAVGRADMSVSDPEALYRSLLRLAEFSPETKVFPGHDYGPHSVSTIGFELEHNPYLQCPDLESFLKLRMG